MWKCADYICHTAKSVSGTMISFSSNTEMRVEELDTFVRTDARLLVVIGGYRWLRPRAVMETDDRCVSTRHFVNRGSLSWNNISNLHISAPDCSTGQAADGKMLKQAWKQFAISKGAVQELTVSQRVDMSVNNVCHQGKGVSCPAR